MFILTIVKDYLYWETTKFSGHFIQVLLYNMIDNKLKLKVVIPTKLFIESYLYLQQWMPLLCSVYINSFWVTRKFPLGQKDKYMEYTISKPVKYIAHRWLSTTLTLPQVPQQWSYCKLLLAHRHINGLMHERHNSIANALELRLPYTNPLIRYVLLVEVYQLVCVSDLSCSIPVNRANIYLPHNNGTLGVNPLVSVGKETPITCQQHLVNVYLSQMLAFIYSLKADITCMLTMKELILYLPGQDTPTKRPFSLLL